MTRKQLVDLAILLGSDFCPKIKGIGPALAPDLIRIHKNIETVLQNLDKNKYEIPPNFDFEEVRKIFLEPRVHRANQTKIDWAKPREDQLVQFLCSKGVSETNAKQHVKRLLKVHPVSCLFFSNLEKCLIRYLPLPSLNRFLNGGPLIANGYLKRA